MPALNGFKVCSISMGRSRLNRIPLAGRKPPQKWICLKDMLYLRRCVAITLMRNELARNAAWKRHARRERRKAEMSNKDRAAELAAWAEGLERDIEIYMRANGQQAE